MKTDMPGWPKNQDRFAESASPGDNVEILVDGVAGNVHAVVRISAAVDAAPADSYIEIISGGAVVWKQHLSASQDGPYDWDYVENPIKCGVGRRLLVRLVNGVGVNASLFVQYI